MFMNEKMDQELIAKKSCLVRVYVIDCEELNARDEDSLSDPYLVIKCGKKVINDQENYQKDTTNPQFYKCFEYIFMTNL